MFGDETLELKRFAIRVLSLTCSSSGCGRSYKENKPLAPTKNEWLGLCNLKSKQIKKTIVLPFYEIQSDDEWIIEDEYEVELEHPKSEDDVMLEPDVDDAQEDHDADEDGDDDDVIRGLDI
ncbi:hypothetical protein HKD37_01G001729 [Glycine soja]